MSLSKRNLHQPSKTSNGNSSRRSPMEEARLTQLAYAIEYDYCDPRQLHPTLETSAWRTLFRRTDQRDFGLRRGGSSGTDGGH